MNQRISNAQLGQIDLALTPHEREMLRTMKMLRYMRTSQVQRLFFPSFLRTPRAAATATTRKLNRFKDLGLITHLGNRVKTKCSASYELVWHLTEAGLRLLDMIEHREYKRKNHTEPSPTFIRHILAVTECYVQINAICKAEEGMRVKTLALEPECWRAYQKDGKGQSLRPDLYAETVCSEYVDHWFIEMDLDTEAIPEVINKCRRYHEYYQTNKEQHAVGVFPIVLWIVPTPERKEKMVREIKVLFSRYANIFLVITPDEFHDVLKNGAKEENLC